MATHDYNLANQDGASFRSDLNNALSAIVSNNSSSTAPATTFAHQIWVDTTANVVKQRNAANDAWVELWRIDGGFNAKTFSSNITLNAQSDLRFADSDSSNWVAFQAPATVASNVTWTLPSADGSADQALTTNGSGVLSWADAGGVQDNITEGNTSAEVVDTGSDGHFKVVTEGTEALRVDSSQNVGIGTPSPERLLHVFASDTSIASNSSSTLVLERNGVNVLQILKPNGTAGILGFSGNSTNADGRIIYDDSSSRAMEFWTASAERARIDSSGNLGLGTSSPSTFNDAGTGGKNLVIGSTGTGRGVLTFASEQTGGADEPLGIINFVDSDTTNTATRGARIIGHRGSDANSAYLKFETANSGNPTERMRISPSGILAGSTSTWDSSGSNQSFYIHNTTDRNVLKLSNGDAGSAPYGLIGFYRNKGSVIGRITTDGSTVTYGTSSDYRLKENVVDLDGAITRVKQLAPKRFNWIADETDSPVDGFLAHEAQVVVPEAVVGEKDEVDDEGNPVYQGIDQSKLVPLLTAALQEAIGKIETLEAKVAALEAA